MILLVPLLLAGCQMAPVQENQQTESVLAYRGTVPCADCSGIDQMLLLDTDGTFVLQSTYQGRASGNNTFSDYGLWRRDGQVIRITLNDSNSTQMFFQLKGRGLDMLDTERHPIQSRFNYHLQPVAAQYPIITMKISGMYRYYADSATFEDCNTGKTFVMLASRELEAGYLQARQGTEDQVLLSLQGHFATLPSMEEGKRVKTVVPEGSAQFYPGRDCDTAK